MKFLFVAPGNTTANPPSPTRTRWWPVLERGSLKIENGVLMQGWLRMAIVPGSEWHRVREIQWRPCPPGAEISDPDARIVHVPEPTEAAEEDAA